MNKNLNSYKKLIYRYCFILIVLYRTNEIIALILLLKNYTSNYTYIYLPYSESCLLKSKA
jgi:hypothetical protein